MNRGWLVGGTIATAAACLVAMNWLGSPVAWGQFGTSNPPQEGAPLVVYQGPGADGWQHILVVEPTTRVMASYQLHPTTGQISLKSVRKLAFDLQMDDFNGAEPSSQDVRQMIERH